MVHALGVGSDAASLESLFTLVEASGGSRFQAADETEAVAAYISGAGPTIVAVAIDDDDALGKRLREYVSGLDVEWTVRKMHVHRQGAQLRLL